MDFCIGEFLSGFILLIRNIAYNIVATTVMYYGSTYLNTFLYISMILAVTNLVVLFDCFVVSHIFDCLHTFNNLENVNPELYERVKEAALKCDCEIKNYYVVDASKDTKHSNAYVESGTCVMSDTLIVDLPDQDQLLAVVRHEMGHAKMNHVFKNMLLRCMFYSLMFVSLSFCLLFWEN